MNKIMKWLTPAFDVATVGGASARKLSAFWVIVFLISTVEIVWLYSAYKKDQWGELWSVLTLDFGFAASCLGMTTYQYVQERKIDKSTPPSVDDKPKDEEKIG